MTEIIKKELYDGKVAIDFYPNSHAYKINGERIISVTAITGVIDKSQPLMAWAINQMRDYLLDMFEKGIKIDINNIHEAAKNYRNVSKEAKDVGSQVHAWAEAFANAKLNKTEEPKIEDDFPQEVLQGINAFVDWYKDNKVEFIDTERMVYSKKYNYCGFFDVLAKVNGKLYLIDYKTSKGIYPEMNIQLAGYRFALEEEVGDIKIFGNMILQFNKETGECTEHKCEDYLSDLEAFMGLLKVKKYLQNNK